MLVRRLNLRTLVIAVLTFAAISAAHAQSTPEEVVHTYMAGFNSGDLATSAALNASAGTTIIDEFAPYTWTGPKAFDDWGAAFGANSKALGITEAKVTLGALIVKNVTSGQAYLTYPAVFTYKVKGTSTRETAHMAFALRKEASAWKIAAWTWTGTVPKPVR